MGSRINSTRTKKERGLDAYFSPPEAVIALKLLEPAIFGRVWEPACGNGAISSLFPGCLETDIEDYGLKNEKVDYLKAKCPGDIRSIVTNPPFQLGQAFLEKALQEVPYVAFLLRINFLEATRRQSLFEKFPPSRILIPSRRLPMMHQYGWEGKRAPSNTCHPWFIWDKNSEDRTRIIWYDWAKFDKED